MIRLYCLEQFFLSDPTHYQKCEACLLIRSVLNFESLLGAPLIKQLCTNCIYLCRCVLWAMTCSMPLGVPINWNISSNWNQRVLIKPHENVIRTLQTLCSRIFTTMMSYYNNFVSTRRAKCCRNTIKHTYSICHISFEKEYGSAYCLFK